MEFGQLGDTIGGLFQLSKVDVFILAAYKIITKDSILNGNHIQGSLSVVGGGARDGESAGSALSVHPQYATTFNKISKIFNVLLSKGKMGEEAISKKSPIELFHRFQQIMKEIVLSFETSPYSRFFNKINDNLFQIRDNSALREDPYWKDITDDILSVYSARTGKMINQNRRKNNSNNNTSEADKRKQALAQTKNMMENDFINMTTNLLDDVSLSQQLNKRLQHPTDATNVNQSRSLNGYYTQPTSPGMSALPFNLDGDDDILSNANFNAATSNLLPQNQVMLHSSSANGSMHRKRRSLGSINIDAINDNAMDEMLKFTNISKRMKVDGESVQPTNSNGNDNGTGLTKTAASTATTMNNNNNNNNMHGQTPMSNATTSDSTGPSTQQTGITANGGEIPEGPTHSAPSTMMGDAAVHAATSGFPLLTGAPTGSASHMYGQQQQQQQLQQHLPTTNLQPQQQQQQVDPMPSDYNRFKQYAPGSTQLLRHHPVREGETHSIARERNCSAETRDRMAAQNAHRGHGIRQKRTQEHGRQIRYGIIGLAVGHRAARSSPAVESDINVFQNFSRNLLQK
ncbi:uncharacterized protein KNAG_0L02410 [Huiozyma naganishii CBS 8797]|uniref:Uncharacterized protein n=1 Tax=Huiozyma naganishii (strain ATCC MYA-139 / BCRC 22969 / CBS 8797 / KCTC 17520 / NBRC 10181 / NCYC 3082 / Yp74L-3) TaxID=1071383 RepID=J7SB91_HUIN7|nr:hypothetical protein KNAG_0L02410 [Kazachstania naganishii CBS 8797]CCK72856.1 hypothetical protein KNAG_0L02410 [Kazachstania naganishii CBS 8797]